MNVAQRFDAAHARLLTVATTGTNGKTSTTTLVAGCVAQHEKSARLTTLGAYVQGEPVLGKGTEQFLETVERAVAEGVRVLALEMTSKSLAGGLAQRWRPRIGVFTNLSHDHLDMHGSAEAYLASKAQLFMALPSGGSAVLNADDPASELLAEVMPEGVQVFWYGVHSERTLDLRAERIDDDGALTTVRLAPSDFASELGGQLAIGLRGRFQAMNGMAAALACRAAGLSPTAILDGLASPPAVHGRFQQVREAPLTFVDFAHTPDALEKALESARALVPEGARLHCVFGCGGDRDREKRAPMGAVVHRLADVAWLTSDNPRSETPASIAEAVRAGIEGPGASWNEELDRRQAIERAIVEADIRDVVLIAGKGHEQTQTVGDEVRAFDDVAVARQILRTSE